MSTKTEPVPVSTKYYRLLNVGEQLRPGDEFHGSHTKTWAPVTGPYAGQLVATISPPIRRPLPDVPKILAALGPFVEHANSIEPAPGDARFAAFRVASVKWPDLKRVRDLYESLTSTHEVPKEKA